MKPNKLIGLAALVLLVAGSTQAATFTGVDLGTPSYPGSATVTGATTTIVGGGSDIWGTADSGYYYYATVSDQVWDAVVHVENLTNQDGNDDGWSKCELMVRIPDSTGTPVAADPFLALMTTRLGVANDMSDTGVNQVGPQWRTLRGGNADWSALGLTVRPAYPGTWLRIQRTGSLFTLSYGSNGTEWTKYADIDTAKTDVVGGDSGTTFGSPWPETVTIGIAVTAHDDTDMTGAIATLSNLGLTTTPTTPVLQVLQDVQDATATLGTEATFSFSATNTAIPNGLVAGLQWYKNGTAIAGATGPKLTFQTGASDKNAQIHCKATVGGVSLDSRTATLTVPDGVVYPGSAKWEWWDGQTRGPIEAGNLGPADKIMTVTGFEVPANTRDTDAGRLSGYFTPIVTGDYVFFLASDDDSDLFISTDTDPANKRWCAQEAGWSGSRYWVTRGGDPSTAGQKRSDQFTPDDGATYPFAMGIHLEEGKPYYIEAVTHDGGGGDNLAVTYTLLGEAEPLDNDAPKITSAMMSYPTWAVTKLEITTQPQDVTIFEDQNGSFTVVVQTDSETLPQYQWKKNNVDIAGQTSPTYAFTADIVDNGAKISCVITLPGPNLTVTTREALLTVQKAMFLEGLVKRELWGPYASETATRATVEAGTAGEPTQRDYLTAFEGNDLGVSYYVQRLSCLFIPATTGDYVFFACADDTVDLFISTDETAANKRLVAQETSWSNARQWVSTAGGSSLTQKRSDQFSPDDGATTPFAEGIHMEVGKRYYIEAVHQEGTGGDNFGATFKIGLATADPVDGDAVPFKGALVGVLVPAPTRLEITQQPADVTAHGWDQAIFTVAVSHDAIFPATYQWRRDGVAIPGATSSSFSLITTASDNGAKFDCVVSLSGLATGPVTSRQATLTVLNDAVFVAGTLIEERFSGVVRNDVLIGNVGAPSESSLMPSFDAGAGVGDSYCRRVRGIFVPATTGEYVFITCSDDDSDLYLSTDNTPKNKRLIAQETNWSDPLKWTSGGDAAQKRSDTWSPDGGTTVPYAEGIHLEAGQHYYIEGVHHEGGGGDNFAATFKLFEAATPADDTPSAFTAAVIGHMEAPAVVVGPKFSVTRAGNMVTVTSDPQPMAAGFVLQLAPTVNGPWVTQPGANTPITVPIGTEAARFLRAIKP